jgi:hypothetical protein
MHVRFIVVNNVFRVSMNKLQDPVLLLEFLVLHFEFLSFCSTSVTTLDHYSQEMLPGSETSILLRPLRPQR